MKTFIPVFAIAMLSVALPSSAGQRRGGGGHGGGSHGGGSPRGGASHAVRGPSGGYSQRGVVRGGGGTFYGRGFYRPYYTFRPRFSVGFGFWAGYPVAYPYDYYAYPYAYAAPYPVDPYAYGYAPPMYGTPYPPTAYPSPGYSPAYPPSAGAYDPSSSSDPSSSAYPSAPPPSVGVRPGSQSDAPGGVSFQVTPETAAVFVDGTFVGTAGTFGPTMRPLGLVAGHHHIEIRADGYRTMTIEADVTPGQVIPYRGLLQRE